MGNLIIATVGYLVAIIFALTGIHCFIIKDKGQNTLLAFAFSIAAATITKFLVAI